MRLFAAGENAVQVQRWLGHHSPELPRACTPFALTVHVVLLEDDLGEALDSQARRRSAGPTSQPATSSSRSGIGWGQESSVGATESGERRIPDPRFRYVMPR